MATATDWALIDMQDRAGDVIGTALVIEDKTLSALSVVDMDADVDRQQDELDIELTALLKELKEEKDPIKQAAFHLLIELNRAEYDRLELLDDQARSDTRKNIVGIAGKAETIRESARMLSLSVEKAKVAVKEAMKKAAHALARKAAQGPTKTTGKVTV